MVFSKLEKILGTPQTINFRHINTIQVTNTIQTTGVSVQDLGNTYFEYCQPYTGDLNSVTGWNQYNTTGAVKIQLFSGWK